MRPIRLRLQILLILLAPLAIFSPATVFVIYEGVGQVVTREIDSRGTLLARQAAVTITDDVLTGDRGAAEKKLADMAQANDGVSYIFAIDPRGSVVAHTFSGGFPSDLLLLHDSSKLPREPTLVAIDGKRIHDIVEPILAGSSGTLHLGVDIDAVRTTRRSLLMRLTMLGVTVVIAGVVLTLLLSERMVRRLGAIASRADAIGAGDLDSAVGDEGRDEIGRVAKALDEMASRLRVAREERERTLHRMAQTEKLVAVGRLAAGVAHEINNPLSGVVHCLDNIDEQPADMERARAYGQLMREGIGRAQRVVRRLLDYAKEHDLDVRPVDLPALLRRSVALLQPSVERVGVRVVQRHEEGLPAIEADSHMLEQVVMNLLLNALEAMPQGGTLEVESTRRNDGVQFVIRDQGQGIPEAIAGQIFDPFFTTKGGSKGSGLGLSVSLGIVERHGGRVDFHSVAGQGTSFVVSLPLHQSPDHESASPGRTV